MQAEVETFPLRFFGDAQSDRDVDDLEDNVAADAADKQGSQLQSVLLSPGSPSGLNSLFALFEFCVLGGVLPNSKCQP